MSRKTRGICSVDWCTSVCHAHGLCSNHYQIRKRNGHEEAYKRAKNGEGTRGPGPRLISTEYGQEYEHIVICRKAYGELSLGSVIHHLDGIQSNNSLYNLVVCCSGQSQHMRIHWWQDKLAHKVQCIELCDPCAAEKVLHPIACHEYQGMLFTEDNCYVEVPKLKDSYGLARYWRNK